MLFLPCGYVSCTAVMLCLRKSQGLCTWHIHMKWQRAVVRLLLGAALSHCFSSFLPCQLCPTSVTASGFKGRVTASAPFWGNKIILQLSAALSSSVVFMSACKFYLSRRDFTGFSCSGAWDLLARSEAWNSLPMYSRSTFSFCVPKPFKHFNLLTWEQLLMSW